MSSKSLEFRNFFYSTDFQFYAIVETWFHVGIYNNEFFPSDFVVYRCDRSIQNSLKTTGGGVLFAVHSSLRSEQIFVQGSECIEFLCVKVLICNNLYFFIIIYIPPRSPVDIYLKHIDCIGEIVNMHNCNDNIVVLGDFNLTNIHWTVDSDSLEILPSDILSVDDAVIIDSLFSFNLEQINFKPNNNNSFLDLVFVNNTEILSVYDSLESFKNNDNHHNSLEIEFFNVTFNDKCRVFSANDHFYDFKACDSAGMSKYLQCISWDDIFSNNNLDLNVDNFNNVLCASFQRFVPLKKREIIVIHHGLIVI
jgi:hypothetical protein